MDVIKTGEQYPPNYFNKTVRKSPGQNNYQSANDLIPGNIDKSERIDFKKGLPNNIVYKIKYLPETSHLYAGKIFRVIPESICWHWDGGETPKTEDPQKGLKRAIETWDTLVQRTKHKDPVATHFSVGPHSVLQMLPLSDKYIVQGRLSGDHNIQDVHKAESLGGIQIETTGVGFDEKLPMQAQTSTLIELTVQLMRKYDIPFTKICGHLERSPLSNKKIDPGEKYLKATRVLLLKALIKNKDWQLIGEPKEWFFYKETFEDNVIKKEITQTPQEIWNALTIAEKEAFSLAQREDMDK